MQPVLDSQVRLAMVDVTPRVQQAHPPGYNLRASFTAPLARGPVSFRMARERSWTCEAAHRLASQRQLRPHMITNTPASAIAAPIKS